jgi:hypothetical protein
MKYLKRYELFDLENWNEIDGIDPDFEKFKNKIIDSEIKIMEEEDHPNKEYRYKFFKKLRNEHDPKKFISKYKRFFHISNIDLPDSWYKYM